MLNLITKILDNQSIFLRGSRIYNTNTKTSDWDFFVIGETDVNERKLLENIPNTNWEFLSEEEFIIGIKKHDIAILECLWIPIEKQIKHKYFSFDLDKNILRKSFSAKASNSWVKAKKKLIVEEDKDIYIAQKSLFHSFRIFDFGCQIAEYGKIINYSSSNEILKEILQLEPNWDIWYEAFKERHNAIHSKFKLLTNKE